MITMKPDWWSKAACLGVGPDRFFPSQGHKRIYDEPLKICMSCSVRQECYEYGKSIGDGVWGGVVFNPKKKVA
jgi:hypothetical protein